MNFNVKKSNPCLLFLPFFLTQSRLCLSYQFPLAKLIICIDDSHQAGEQMKLEYQRKVAGLNKLKNRGSNTEALERMKAAVSHLHTRYIVDMQSMDSTVSEINRLRDQQLYPKLVALVDA